MKLWELLWAPAAFVIVATWDHPATIAVFVVVTVAVGAVVVRRLR
jgi:hypothetical protein